MTLVRPFPSRIVRQERATDVVCPMHDAMPPAARAELLISNPLSYLQVTRSALDMPNATPQEIGTANSAGLEHLLASGAYSELCEPALYVYRLRQGAQDHTGIVAELDVAAFVDGRVLGHEAVHPDRVQALVHHFDAVPSRSELVTVLHRSDPKIAALVEVTTAAEPLLSLTDFTGVEQFVWRVLPQHVGPIVEALDGIRHYIADGHHRVAATVERWRGHGSPRGGAVLSVVYPDDQMHLLAFHRRVSGPIDAELLLAKLGSQFEVRPSSEPAQGAGQVGLRLGGTWYTVSLGERLGRPGVLGLDVTALDEQVLRPHLGVSSGDPRVTYVSELADLDDVVTRVDADEGALFLLRAPSLDQLIDVAERDQVMPQKSTYIEPKPRAGVFLRPRQGPVDPRDLSLLG